MSFKDMFDDTPDGREKVRKWLELVRDHKIGAKCSSCDRRLDAWQVQYGCVACGSNGVKFLFAEDMS